MRRLTLSCLKAGEYCTYSHHWIQPQPPFRHTHDFHEIFWVEEGEGWHLVNGTRRFLEPRKLVLVRASDAHSFEVTPGNELHLVNFAFFKETWSHFQRRYQLGKKIYFSSPSLPEREFSLGLTHFHELHQNARDLTHGRRDQFAVERFLINLFSILENHREAPRKVIPDWISKVCDDVRRHPPLEEGVLAIARMAGRSPEHLAREFRRYLGRTPTELLNEERMAHAARKLLMTDAEIVDIALECGFQNMGHFYKLFRAKFQQTPHAFRQRQRSSAFPENVEPR